MMTPAKRFITASLSCFTKQNKRAVIHIFIVDKWITPCVKIVDK
jgi:hypothetical protein